MTTSQLVLMILSFAGMFGFAGFAVWLWSRQRPGAPAVREQAPARSTEVSPRGHGAADGREAAPTRAAAPARPAAPAQPPPELPEVTEFVALPGRREDDSPQPHPHRHAGASPAGIEEEVERTEFIAAPLERTAHVGRKGERTEFLRAPDHAPAEERTSFVAPPPELPERTSFVAPPPELPDRTTFVAPPPELPERTTFVAPPPELPERTSFVAPPPELPERTTFVAPPPALQDRPGFAPPAGERTGLFASSTSSFGPPPSIPPSPATPSSPEDRMAPLREHFELAVAALAQLERREDADQATALHGHLEVLAAAPIDPLLELLRPALADPLDTRCDAAWLALLHHKSWPARRALPDLLRELDDRGRVQGRRSLASWDDPRAPSLAAAALEQARGGERRAWLELFAERGWDPGDAAIDEALDTGDPELLILGLRLAGSRRSEQVRAKVSDQLFAADPAVRIEAIETALSFAEQRAWLVCRQLARNPAFPRAAELVGLLGSQSEIVALCQAASAANSTSLLWGLGLSGRAVALQTCAAALADDELRADAQAALTLACGRELESADEARQWLAQAPASARLIGGAPRTLDAIAQTLAKTDSIPLRRAIARELRIRSGGRVFLPAELRPRALRRQLDPLRRLDLDLDRDFPWHGE